MQWAQATQLFFFKPKIYTSILSRVKRKGAFDLIHLTVKHFFSWPRSAAIVRHDSPALRRYPGRRQETSRIFFQKMIIVLNLKWASPASNPKCGTSQKWLPWEFVSTIWSSRQPRRWFKHARFRVFLLSSTPMFGRVQEVSLLLSWSQISKFLQTSKRWGFFQKVTGSIYFVKSWSLCTNICWRSRWRIKIFWADHSAALVLHPDLPTAFSIFGAPSFCEVVKTDCFEILFRTSSWFKETSFFAMVAKPAILLSFMVIKRPWSVVETRTFGLHWPSGCFWTKVGFVFSSFSAVFLCQSSLFKIKKKFVILEGIFWIFCSKFCWY